METPRGGPPGGAKHLVRCRTPPYARHGLRPVRATKASATVPDPSGRESPRGDPADGAGDVVLRRGSARVRCQTPRYGAKHLVTGPRAETSAGPARSLPLVAADKA